MKLGETSFVTKVRELVRRFSLSRVIRSGSGKGKPRLASVLLGSPVAAYYRPPSASYWSPSSSCEFTSKRLRSEDKSFGGDFFAPKISLPSRNSLPRFLPLRLRRRWYSSPISSIPPFQVKDMAETNQMRWKAQPLLRHRDSIRSGAELHASYFARLAQTAPGRCNRLPRHWRRSPL